MQAEKNAENTNSANIGFDPQLHPAWQKLIVYCQNLKHGEVSKLQIQDGLPVSAEYVKKKVKFT